MVTIERPPAKPPHSSSNDSEGDIECDLDSQAPTEVVEFEPESPFEVAPTASTEQKTSSTGDDDEFSRAPTVLVEFVSDESDNSSRSGSDYRISTVDHTSELIRIRGHVGKASAVIMVDSGSTGNFIDSDYVKSHELVVWKLSVPKSVRLADGTTHVCRYYVSVNIRMGKFKHIIQLNVIPLKTANVVLGIPWLQQYEPAIDWKSGSVSVNISGDQIALPKYVEKEEDNMIISNLQFSRLVRQPDIEYGVLFISSVDTTSVSSGND